MGNYCLFHENLLRVPILDMTWLSLFSFPTYQTVDCVFEKQDKIIVSINCFHSTRWIRLSLTFPNSNVQPFRNFITTRFKADLKLTEFEANVAKKLFVSHVFGNGDIQSADGFMSQIFRTGIESNILWIRNWWCISIRLLFQGVCSQASWWFEEQTESLSSLKISRLPPLYPRSIKIASWSRTWTSVSHLHRSWAINKKEITSFCESLL